MPEDPLVVVYTREQISERVRMLGESISRTYGSGDDLLVLGILKGSFIFLADLVREIEIPCQIEFIRVSSYGDALQSSGHVKIGCVDPEVRIRGRTVLLVEDIIDSGVTMNHVVPLLRTWGAVDVEICALLHKRLAALEKEPRWVGFDAPSEFLVGYGLGRGDDLRHLPYIGSLSCY